MSVAEDLFREVIARETGCHDSGLPNEPCLERHRGVRLPDGTLRLGTGSPCPWCAYERGVREGIAAALRHAQALSTAAQFRAGEEAERLARKLKRGGFR